MEEGGEGREGQREKERWEGEAVLSYRQISSELQIIYIVGVNLHLVNRKNQVVLHVLPH